MTRGQTHPLFEPMKGDRIPALDGIRGLAVMLVLWTHFGEGGDITYPGIAGKLFFGIRTIGWAGVDLFFVLSGFLITGILCDSRKDEHYFRNFYMRRTLRIFPLYFGVLIGVFVILPLSSGSLPGQPQNQIWLWLYCSNFYTALTGGYAGQPNPWGLAFGHFWSLAIEEHFYLIWPFIVYFVGNRILLRLCVALSVFALSIRTIIYLRGGSPYFVTPCRMDAIAMGAMSAILIRSSLDQPMIRLGARVAAILSGLSLVSLYPTTHWNPTTLPMASLGFSLIGFLFTATLTCVVLGAASGSWLSRGFCNPILRSLGKYSYGTYVFHGMLLFYLHWLLPLDWLHAITGRYVMSAFLHCLAASCASVAIAWCSWHVYEKHFLRLKRFFEASAKL